MAASTITRDTWTNDTGSAAVPAGDGTILNNAALQNNVYARIDELFAGAGSYATLTLGGKIAVEGFGSHLFSAGGTGDQNLLVRNTTAGTTNTATVFVGNNSSSSLGYIRAFSSTYTTSGPSVASAMLVNSEGAGGLSIGASNVAGAIRFYTGGTTLRGTIDATGFFDWVTGAGTHTFGSASPITFRAACSVAGVANFAAIGASNNASELVQLIALSTTYTTLNYKVQDSGVLESACAAGFNSATWMPYGWWDKPTNTLMMVLTNQLAADNGLFLKSTYSLHVGSITRVGRATTNSTNAVNIYDGTAPVGAGAGFVSLYSTAGELRVMDAGGTATLLSPHDDDGLWVYDSTCPQTGKRLKIDMERLMKAVDAMLGGGYVHETDLLAA